MTVSYPKRLIEVDLPIKRISTHARREKSIRHGHISTLHIWWARRPLAACRAVICASLWPDPADPLCPPEFRQTAATQMIAFAKAVHENTDLTKICDGESWKRYGTLAKENHLNIESPQALLRLRNLLLDFIADFAAWEASTQKLFLVTARALTQAAHESLGGAPGTRPLVVDPFAGGGSIPLEALRVGADAFASDLNPVAVLLNKVVLEYIPKYGQKLADEVRKWGQWVKERAEKELAEYYPKDPDGSTPIAYLWARTVQCEGPNCGAQVPLMRSLWLAKKASRSVALKIIPNPAAKRVDFEIIHPVKASEVGNGTVARGSATCPCCGYTTPVASVRVQLKARKGGAADARLFTVVTTRPDQQGRFYRTANGADLDAVARAACELGQRRKQHNGPLALVPEEPISTNEIRRISVPLYGMATWGDLFTPRQLLALATVARLVQQAARALAEVGNHGLTGATQTCLAMAVDRQVDATSSLSRWHTTGEKMTGMFGRQALGMVWDFAEVNPNSDSTGGFAGAVEWVGKVCEGNVGATHATGSAEHADAAAHPLPDGAAAAFITDPPYYDAVPYSHLSDLFYVWLRRTLAGQHPMLLDHDVVAKEAEIVVDRAHTRSNSKKDVRFYEDALARAFREGRRITRPAGVGVIIFASKTTASWEAILQAIVDAGWVIGGSWPVDTEMEARVAAQGQARLASSVHIFCRPRASTGHEAIGDWRTVLQELPPRIHAWMPRLAEEGVVGADAIFACLGPALEIFSRYTRVEKANGEKVTLREYLQHVWAAVAQEALKMVFTGADAGALEEDARLTAIWLWTLGASAKDVAQNGGPDDAADDEQDPESGDNTKPVPVKAGYTLEYDAARKIAQGLGANLEQLSDVVEIKGDKARLLDVFERTRKLFGKDQAAAPAKARKKAKQASFFQSIDEIESQDGGWGDKSVPKLGTTVLDRVHQSMILFAAARGEALKRFLVEEGAGSDARFWKLAQALSALYPPGTDEKRWVDGVLARKKGLGL